MNRRTAIQIGINAMASVTALGLTNHNEAYEKHSTQDPKPMMTPPTYPFKLPPLAFEYDALEPHIDLATMKLHHDKHHQTYVDNLNAALKEYPELHDKSVEQLLRGFKDLPESIKPAVRNQGGGHANHQLFWKIIRPVGTEGAGGNPAGKLADAIVEAFGSAENMKKAFNEAGAKVFGSGWVFLVADPQTLKLKIHTTANQDSVLLEGGMAALIANDCWEHAYYLKYQNKRAEYLAAFWNVVAWDIIATRFEGIESGKAHL